MIAQQPQFGAQVVAPDLRECVPFGQEQPRDGQGVGLVGLVLRPSPPAILRRAVGAHLMHRILTLREQGLGEALAQ